MVALTAIATSQSTAIPTNNIVASATTIFSKSSAEVIYYVQPITMVTSTTSCSLPKVSTTFPYVTASTIALASSYTLSSIKIPDPDVKNHQFEHIFLNKRLKQVFCQIYHQKYHFFRTKKITDNKNKHIFPKYQSNHQNLAFFKANHQKVAFFTTKKLTK